MREQLLGNMVSPRPSRPLVPLPRLRGSANEGSAAISCCGVLIVAFFILKGLFFTAVSPLEYGLLKSVVSGAVDPDAVQGGLHMVIPGVKYYVTFPATRVTLQWSSAWNANGQPVTTRTGPDPKDPDSGGQPITVSCAVQFQFIKEQLKEVYLNFGSYEAAKQRYTLLAYNMVSNTAQKFTPQDFWQRRKVISETMLHQVDGILKDQGARAVSFEIMKVVFFPTFEDSITGVQVAEQQKVVNEYSQQVQQVEQSINVLFSHNNAEIAQIQADATRKATEMVGNATRAAFHVKQTAKADMYRQLQQKLELTTPQMQQYIKIRSLMAQSESGKVVVNVAPPEVASAEVTAAGRVLSELHKDTVMSP